MTTGEVAVAESGWDATPLCERLLLPSVSRRGTLER
jgi:hypothetical protein